MQSRRLPAYDAPSTKGALVGTQASTLPAHSMPVFVDESPAKQRRIDNPSETDWEEREMCLDAGMYVFAFARGSSNANGLAIVGFGVHFVGGQPHFEEVPDLFHATPLILG